MQQTGDGVFQHCDKAGTHMKQHKEMKDLLEDVRIPAGQVDLEGTLDLPAGCWRVVVFAHGSGSSRFSPRNRFVATGLSERRIGTLLLDLLTPEEDLVYRTRFDINLLATRLAYVTEWLNTRPDLKTASVGLFGASTGAAAALETAAEAGQRIRAVVSRGGRPDLAEGYLHLVRCPTLLIVGGHDVDVLKLNQDAFRKLTCEKQLAVVPGATHLFEEPGKLEEVARLAGNWFERYL
jgi:pimeloyl-ACP methyl ester carboxylesterase